MIIAYILLLLLFATLISWQYERVALRRIFALRRIRKICREKNIKFKVLNHAYFLSSNMNNKFDFILRIEKTVIPVKFFSSLDKSSTAIIDQAGKIHIRRKVRELLGRDGKAEYRSWENIQDLPYMMIEKRIIGERMKYFPVFLNEPPYETVFYSDTSGEISEFYDVSKQVAGCNFVDARTFEDLITLYMNREEN